MSDLKMGPVETRFAEIIWDKEPVGSTELVRLAEEVLGWKKSTTYTVLKRLCDRGIFQNEGGTVTSRLSRADYDTAQSQQFVEESFSGSLPVYHGVYPAKKADRGRNCGAAKADRSEQEVAYGRVCNAPAVSHRL